MCRKKKKNDIKVSDIAAKVNSGKSTIYKHFESKEEIFKEMINDKYETLINHFDEIINDDSLSMYEKMEEARKIRISSINDLDFESITIGFENYPLEIENLIISWHKEVRNKIETVLKMALDSGYLKENVNVKVVSFLSAHIDRLIRRDVLHELQISSQELIDQMMEIIIYGIINKDIKE